MTTQLRQTHFDRMHPGSARSPDSGTPALECAEPIDPIDKQDLDYEYSFTAANATHGHNNSMRSKDFVCEMGPQTPPDTPHDGTDADAVLRGSSRARGSARSGRGGRLGLAPRITILLAIAAVWILVMWRLAANLPPMKDKDGESVSIRVPHSFEQLKADAEALREYSRHNGWPVFRLFTLLFVFKQTFAVPGSTLANVACGILYGYYGFPLVTLLTAVGSTSSYLVSKLVLGEGVVARFAPGSLGSLRSHVDSNRAKGSLFYYLLFLRLFPFSPNWFLNIASPFIGIPIVPFFLSILLGLMPYNYICIQAAATISSLNSFSDMLSVGTMLQLLFISVLALIPVFCGDAIAAFVRARISGFSAIDTQDKHSPETLA